MKYLPTKSPSIDERSSAATMGKIFVILMLSLANEQMQFISVFGNRLLIQWLNNAREIKLICVLSSASDGAIQFYDAVSNSCGTGFSSLFVWRTLI
jgi:hypothetical protein